MSYTNVFNWILSYVCLNHDFKLNMGRRRGLYFHSTSSNLYSTDFKMSEDSRISLCFCVDVHDKFLSLYIVLLSAEKQSIHLKYKCSILKKGIPIYSKEDQDNFSVQTKESFRDNPRGFNEFICLEKFIDMFLLSLNSEIFELPLQCEIMVDASDKLVNPAALSIPKSTLTQTDEYFFDVIFYVKNHEFSAHKCVLAYRSPVFKAMFQSHMSEQKETVVIEDTDPEIFRCLLDHIYTDNVDVDVSSAPELLCAVEKYNLIQLKASCEKSLIEALSVENAVDILVAADAHNASTLKSAAVQFISKHPREVSKTKSWDETLRAKPDLISECLNVIFAEMKS